MIVFSPFYENYGADAILSGADPIYVPLEPPAFGFDPAALEAAFAQGAKAIIVCNPSNPCGKVFSRAELEYILKLAQQYDAFVITDEVYEHIVFPPYQHVAAGFAARWQRAGNYLQFAFQNILYYRLALGFLIARADVAENVKKVHDFLTVGAPGAFAGSGMCRLCFGEILL